MSTPQRYVIRPEDANRGWRIARLAADGLRRAAHEARDDGHPREVIIREFQPPRTDPQRMTLWMWHGEVASELSRRTGKRWSKDDVHEMIFLPRWMPQIERMDPETGEVMHRPMRTSERPPDGDDRSAKEIVSEAMTAYLAWAYQAGIDVTAPEDGW